MFRQNRRAIGIKVGNPIAFEAYAPRASDRDALAAQMRSHLYRIARGASELFTTQAPIAHPELRTTLQKQLSQFPLLGQTHDGKRIYLCSDLQGTPLLREIGRLREVSFRAVGEGVGRKRDTDAYDTWYQHILVWDPDDLEIAGAYRIARSETVVQSKGVGGLYTHSLFEFDPTMAPILESGLELGRSFVQPNTGANVVWTICGRVLAPICWPIPDPAICLDRSV